MSESDALSDQEQVLMKELESRTETRWKMDMKLMIEESLSRILEEVLTRKLGEVGFTANVATMQEHRDPVESHSSMGIVRSWAAGKVAKTLERPRSASSIGASTNLSTFAAEQVPSKSRRKREVECVLPSCNPCEENSTHLIAPHELAAKEQCLGCQTTPAIMVSQASDIQAPAPKQGAHMSKGSSLASAQKRNSGALDDNVVSMKYPKSSKIGRVQSPTGHAPRAWDPDRLETFDYCARSSLSSQSMESLFSESRQHIQNIAGQFTRHAMLKRLPTRFENSSYLHMLCASMVLHKRFDFFVSSLILANAASMGLSADRQAKDIVEAEPLSYLIVEATFFFLFAGELVLRLLVHRWEFFQGPGCGWNIFDFLLVKAQLLDGVLHFLSSGSQGIGFVGALRMLRLVRVIRLARILRLIKELRILVSSISNSMRSLAWTLVLMFLMVYSVSLCITQLVTDKRISAKTAGYGELEELTLYFGSLSRSMLSLFEAIAGGVDWDVIVVPLVQDVHPLLAFLFVIYVAVSILALMNVVTGVFVDSVLASARTDKEQFLLHNAKQLFTIAEEEMDWEAFKGKMDTPQMLEFFKGIDVDPSEAKDIFTLIDWDQSGTINVEEFLNGCIRLHGPSKALGTAVLHQELRNLRRELRSHRAES